MLRVLIIEDEAPARERLAAMLAETTPPCTVAGAADSLASAGLWLRKNPAPDLIFADIQLGDGLSLELFRATPPPCPVVFITAHDDYLLEAFATHGIAYLLKPVKRAELDAALQKYRTLGQHYAANLLSLAASLSAPATPARRQRILAQRGTTFQPVAIARRRLFFLREQTHLPRRARGRALPRQRAARHARGGTRSRAVLPPQPQFSRARRRREKFHPRR